MKSADYWRGRFSIIQDAAHRAADQRMTDLETIYRETERTIQADLERWYGRFAVNNGISLTDARKMLTTGQLEEFKWTVDQYIQIGQQVNLSPEWIKKLENASTRFHISRLESIQLQIQQQVELLYGNQLDSLDSLMRKVTGEGYTRTAFEIQKGVGYGWDISALNQRKLETLLSKPWTADNKTFRDRCWEGKAGLVSGIQTRLTQALLRGDSLQRLTDDIKHQFRVSRYKAGRLAHTETTYFNAAATREVYRDLDVKEVEIIETLDKFTCDLCGPLDGTKIPMAQYEPGVTVPPFHPNCRGTTAPTIDESIVSQRAARDDAGAVYYVPSNMTYKAWKAAFVDSGAKDGLTVALSIEAFEKLRSEARKKQNELDAASRELSQVKTESRLAGLGGYTDKVQELTEKENAIQEKIKGLQTDLDKIFKDAKIESDVGKALFTSTIDRLPVSTLDKPMSVDEIIAKLGGGDRTKGSCSSLGFAYIGNHNGIDVTDFRGGASQDFFSMNRNIAAIAKLPGVSSVIENNYNDITGATNLLKTVVEDKLYYLATGRHAAIVRKLSSGGYEYLELQSATNNGFHALTKDSLRHRFGCQRSHTFAGRKYAIDSILIDVDSLKGNREFEHILGYLNTLADKQMKGVSGYAK